jgi:hypothetical protein
MENPYDNDLQIAAIALAHNLTLVTTIPVNLVESSGEFVVGSWYWLIPDTLARLATIACISTQFGVNLTGLANRFAVVIVVGTGMRI